MDKNSKSTCSQREIRSFLHSHLQEKAWVYPKKPVINRLRLRKYFRPIEIMIRKTKSMSKSRTRSQRWGWVILKRSMRCLDHQLTIVEASTSGTEQTLTNYKLNCIQTKAINWWVLRMVALKMINNHSFQGLIISKQSISKSRNHKSRLGSI